MLPLKLKPNIIPNFGLKPNLIGTIQFQPDLRNASR